MREVLALPVRLGGLGLWNPINMAKEQHTASQQILSAPLVNQIIHQEHQLGECHTVQQNTKARLRSHKRTLQKEAKNLQNQLPRTLQRSMKLSQEK